MLFIFEQSLPISIKSPSIRIDFRIAKTENAEDMQLWFGRGNATSILLWRTVMPSLLHDLQFALRQLRKNPGMTALAVMTLALGVGANTGIFTVIESVLLRPLPYANSNRLVYLGGGDPGSFTSTSWLTTRTSKGNPPCFSAWLGIRRMYPFYRRRTMPRAFQLHT